MHIALVSRWYPPVSRFGGIAAYNDSLCRMLVKQGHKVTVLSSRGSSEAPASEVIDGVSVHRLRHPYRTQFARLPFLGRYARTVCQLIYSFRAARRLRRLEKDDPPDAVEFADVEAEGFAYLLGKRRCPVVVRCHAPIFLLRRYYTRKELGFDPSTISRLEKYCIRRADAVSAPSHDMAASIAGECGIALDRISVIPNPVEMDAFARSRRAEENHAAATQHGPRTEDFTVVHVGRLERAKGVEVLARAAALVLAHNPRARFVYVGGANNIERWRHRLESLLGSYGNTGRLVLVGEADQSAVANWYRQADLAAVPSLLPESFSYTCAQAMAAGVPVVASRIGGIPETLDYGASGMLVEPGSSEELARAIIHLAENPRLREALGRAGRTRAANLFATSRVTAQTALFYASVARTELAAEAQPVQ